MPKKQFIVIRQEEIEQRAANFLRLVPEKLEFYCPSYKEKLSEIQSRVNEYTIQEIFDFTQTQLTERRIYSLSQFFRIDGTDPNIPANRREQLTDKAFVVIHHIEEEKYGHHSSISVSEWAEDGFERYLPIELFGLTLANENHEVSGEKNQGIFCFALRGRIIEMTIEKGKDDIYHTFVFGIRFRELNRNNAVTIFLKPENAEWCKIKPHMIYVAEIMHPNPKCLIKFTFHGAKVQQHGESNAYTLRDLALSSRFDHS